MSARSMWNGALELGTVTVPIKVYAAVQDAKVHFNLLHDEDLTRLKQRWVSANDDEADAEAGSDAHGGESAKVEKAYPLDSGELVVLHDTELEALEPKASRSITVSAFVPRAAVEATWFLRPYYLGPHNHTADYFAMARALSKRDELGIAHWVMRKRAYHGALFVNDGYLMLSTLRSREEVLLAPQVAAPNRAFDARELKMAEQLIDALKGEFDATAFEDQHRQRVLQLIDDKSQGKTPKPAKKTPRSKSTPSLGDALEQSLRALKKERKSA